MKKLFGISIVLLLLLPIIALGQDIGQSCVVETITVGVLTPHMFSDIVKIMEIPDSAERLKLLRARVDTGDFLHALVGTKIIKILDIAYVHDSLEKCVLAEIEGVQRPYWLMAGHLNCTGQARQQAKICRVTKQTMGVASLGILKDLWGTYISGDKSEFSNKVKRYNSQGQVIPLDVGNVVKVLQTQKFIESDGIVAQVEFNGKRWWLANEDLDCDSDN